MDLEAYIADMPRRIELAKRLKTDPRYLYQIATKRRQASAKLALAIEAETGISRQELRPDIYPAERRVRVGRA
jgi:DNA-binding transcriptional regulator YdaS (Cro superfamily)